MNVKTIAPDKTDEFHTGAHRGSQENKPRYDLISVLDLEQLQIEAGGAPIEIEIGGGPITDYLDDTGENMIAPLFINRVNALAQRGAEHYGRDNWKKGISLARTFASLFRHVIQWSIGDTSEDHLAAIAWNAMVLMWTEYRIANGKMDWGLADKGPLKLFFDLHRPK